MLGLIVPSGPYVLSLASGAPATRPVWHQRHHSVRGRIANSPDSIGQANLGLSSQPCRGDRDDAAREDQDQARAGVVLLPILPRPGLWRVVPVVPMNAQPPALAALQREVQQLREELAAVRAWCEGLEDEQALLWRSRGGSDANPGQ
jgi:hypothetical protein